jgi:hypothetical protein
MDDEDKFLNEYRKDPRPGYARRLRETLRAEEDEHPARAWRPMLAAAAVLVVVVALFAFPAVRAGAQSVLDLFRVRNFVAIPYDAERLDKLRSLDHDRAMLVFDRHDVIQEPGPPVVQASPAMASATAGFPVESPTYLPEGLAIDTVAVTHEGRVRLGVSTARLREVLSALDLRDVELPAGLDGQDLMVHMYPVVAQSYRSASRRLELIQSRSPEVSLPAGMELARLGELGLRILGLDAGEARRIAASVDWRSTLLVPVPTNASSFRSVTVHGDHGLLVTVTGEGAMNGGRRRGGTVVMWTEGDRVFALQGTLAPPDMMQVAESVR